MENNPVTIQTALKTARNANNVEVIELPLEGDQRVLVRSKLMPEYAFLLWSSHRSGTRSWLGLDIPCRKDSGVSDHRSASYQVVCACCDTQTYGVNKPEGIGESDSEAYKLWSKELGKKFIHVLKDTCKTHGIKIVFVRRAEAWNRQHSVMDGIQIVEAMQYQDAMLDLYGRRIVEANTRFISRETSEGMFGH